MTSSPYIKAYDNGLFDKVCHMYGLELVGFSSSLDSCGYGIGIGDNTHGDDSPFKWVYARCRRIRCHVCLPHSIVEAAQQVCRVLLGHRVLGELGYFDRITKMLQHYVYSYSAEHAEDYKNPVKRKRRRKAAIRAMLKLGLSFFINITHHLRMNDGLKGGYWSPHEHFLGIGYIDVKAYQEEYKLEIAEWRRHKRLVKEGRAEPEPERGPRRLAFRRRFRNQINNETERVLRNQLKCDLKAAPDKAARAAIRDVFPR